MITLATKEIKLTNAAMDQNRFGRWANARRRISWIKSNLEAGREVYVCSQTRRSKYTKKHVDMFKATKSGAYVQSGKNWLCIDFNQIISQ